MDGKQQAAVLTAQLTAVDQPFEVIDADVLGRTMRVWKNAPGCLADLLVAGNGWGDLPFLVHNAESMSYAEHGRAAASFARWLVSSAGLRLGQRVAIAGSNRILWSVAFWGASAAGAVVVPLNSWGTGEELAYAVLDSGASVLIGDEARLERVTGLLPDSLLVVAMIGPSASHPGAPVLAEIADATAPFVLPAVPVDTDDDATIFYTSGTTGRPKGAVGTHRNITTNVMNLLYWGTRAKALAELRGQVLPPVTTAQEGTLVTVPLFHATGCHATLVTAMVQGLKLVLLNRFDAKEAVDLIEKERLTRLVGVPTTVLAVLDAGLGRDLSSLTYVGYGGSPAPPSLPARIRQQLPGSAMGVGYGLTESSANATTNMGQEYEDHPDSVGTPCPVIEIVAVDDEGRTLPAGQVGELVISGPNVVRGYWQRPQESAEAFLDGRLRTGDVGYLDEDGRVYISDRLKDVVIRGGENVYCAEVEAILGEHPQVREAAVIGRPHPQLGEEVIAVVCVAEGEALEPIDLQHFVRGRLASFKVPTFIRLTTEPLPRTPTGKLLKNQLRDEFLSFAAASER